MRTHAVVLLAESIQPALPLIWWRRSPPQQSRCQATVESLDFALRLRMLVATEVQFHILIHQPHCELAPAQTPLRVEPGGSVVHQHFLRNTMVAKNPL